MKILLKIKPIHNDYRGCGQDAIVTVVNWLEMDYAILFSESWGFCFDISKYDKEKNISNCLSADYGQIDRILSRYYGLYYKWEVSSDYYQVIREIENQLINNLPVMIKLDTYFCPWDYGYKKYHVLDHVLLIVGIDTENNLFYITDCFNGVVEKQINIELCFPIGNIKYAKFAKQRVKSEKLDIKKLITITNNKLKRPLENKKSFDMISDFGEILCPEIIFNEILKNEQIWASPLLTNLYEISKGRRQFLDAFKYLCKKENEYNIMAICEMLENASVAWRTVLSMIVKFYYSKDPEYLTRVKIKISTLAQFEADILDKLNRICFTNNQQRVYNEKYCENSRIKNEKIFLVDCHLKKLFNNKAFGKSIYDTNGANLTLMGDYFLDQGFSKKTIFNEKFKFVFSNVRTKNPDNISCFKQQIDIHMRDCCKIQLLGCSECGRYRENLKIKYSDGTIEMKIIDFPEWNYKLDSNDTILMDTKGIIIDEKGEKNIINHSYLYGIEIDVSYPKKILSIILPDCPNIHIFAITFCLIVC